MRFSSEAMSGAALHGSVPALPPTVQPAVMVNSLYPVLSGYPMSGLVSHPPTSFAAGPVAINLNRTDISHGKSKKAPGMVHNDNPSPSEVEAGRCLALLNHSTLKAYPCSAKGRISSVKLRASHWTEVLHFVTYLLSMGSGSFPLCGMSHLTGGL